MTGPRPGVIHVTPYYPPHLGGVELVAQFIAESLASTRQVEVLTSICGARDQPRVERSGRLTVRRLRGFEIAHTPVMPALASRLLRARRDCIVHVHVAQAFSPEVVWLTSKLRRRAFVAHFHLDVDPSGPAGRWLSLYKDVFLAPALRAASAVIVLSAEQARFVAERYGVRRERVIVIPNGVSPGFAGHAERHSRGQAPLRILFVGRLSPQKNVPRLIEAVRRMARQAELVVVGDGPDRALVTGLVDRLGLQNVRLVGRQDHGTLGSWYQWADVFVLSSDKEGMPLAALEAMSSGLPIVATDVPGLRELVSGSGIVVPPDPLSLARALDTLAADPACRRRLAAQSRDAAHSAGWDQAVGRIEGLYLAVSR